MVRAIRIALVAGLVATAGVLWLQAAQSEAPRGPVYDQGRLPEGAVWAVDPRDPGPSLPPAGRSLFDFLTTRQEGAARVQRVPFPFAALLAEIEERLGRLGRLGQAPGEPSPLKAVLIPLGRSLQRSAAGSELFRYPRAVIGVDTDPRPGAGDGMILKDRLYLGYHEKAAVLEVISYNEAAGRFEFQLVRDYRPGGAAQVVYANRAVCTACHQGGGPIFSRQVWDETNANPRVARLLAAEGRDFYGLPVSQGVDVPGALDAATDRANRLAVDQLLWREGCGSDPDAIRCRAAAFTAALQRRLSGGILHDGETAAFFLGIARRVWEALRPQGLAIPDPDIPNRDPLTPQGVEPVSMVSVPAVLGPDEAERLAALVRRSHVPAVFEPLSPRPPLEIWTAGGAGDQGPRRLIAGLAELFTVEDARRLDRYLFTEGSRPGRPRQSATAPCRVTVQRREEGPERVKIHCAAEGLVLEGRLFLAGDRVTGGTVSRLEVAGGTLRDLNVIAGSAVTPVTTAAGRREVGFEVAQALSDLHARRADGNALERVRLSWRDGEPGGEATVVFLTDFGVAAAAVEKLASRGAFSSRPFGRAATLAPLFAELGIPVTACCLEDAGMPPPLLEPGGEAGPDDFPEPAIKTLYRYCARCHATPEATPPNFLYGDVERVRANLARCAERMFYRLDLWHLPPPERSKTPMPPIHALSSLGLSAESWPADPDLDLLRRHALALVRAETGAAPRLEDLEARGYESLRSCMAAAEPAR